jgi:PAS domain-containing protein
LAGEYFFIAPRGSFKLDNAADSITIFLFVLVGFAMAFLAHSQRRARHRAEEQMAQRIDAETSEREIRERLQITLSSIGDAVLSTDADGRIVFANRIALGILKLREAEVLGKHLDEIFRIYNEYSRVVVESPVAKVFREGKVVGMANHTVLLEVLQLQRWGSGRVSGWGLAGGFCSRSASSLPRLSSPACDGTFASHSVSGTWKS